MKKLLPFLFFLISCNANRDHWTLKSYDKDEGYVFEKNGVEYRASCAGTGSPVLGPASNRKPDTDPEAVPPNPAEDESACGEILRYLHKPIPNFKLVGSTTKLLYIGEKNYRLEFEIKEAK
jgi:hypothetical protein